VLAFPPSTRFPQLFKRRKNLISVQAPRVSQERTSQTFPRSGRAAPQETVRRPLLSPPHLQSTVAIRPPPLAPLIHPLILPAKSRGGLNRSTSGILPETDLPLLLTLMLLVPFLSLYPVTSYYISPEERLKDPLFDPIPGTLPEETDP